MLQLSVKDVDICRITKLLARYPIKASITNSVITLNGAVSAQLLEQLCRSRDIKAVQNFINDEPLYVPKKTVSIESNETKKQEGVHDFHEPETNRMECKTHHTAILINDFQYNSIYDDVKRGQLYWCDFGEPYGREIGFFRYAIVVQSDFEHIGSSTTVVVPCTTQVRRNNIPAHLRCYFSPQNMIDFNWKKTSVKENIILVDQIRTIDKSRLRKYLGTLSSDFMNQIDEKIKLWLCSQEPERYYAFKSIENSLHFKKEKVPIQMPKELRNTNMYQEQLLSLVDINEIRKITQAQLSDESKVQKILELFGFDFNKNGVLYLHQAILVSLQDGYFNLETLTKRISEKEGMDQTEIKRLIIARVKERFNFKKIPAIDFIRLVHNVIKEQGEDHDETNI